MQGLDRVNNSYSNYKANTNVHYYDASQIIQSGMCEPQTGVIVKKYVCALILHSGLLNVKHKNYKPLVYNNNWKQESKSLPDHFTHLATKKNICKKREIIKRNNLTELELISSKQ